MSNTERSGAARRRRAQGVKADRIQEIAGSLDPAIPNWVDNFVFEEVWGRPGLSYEQRQMVAIAVLAAGGHATQLRLYLHGALQDGVPEETLKEILLMLGVYCGFPVMFAALFEWQRVLREAGRPPQDSPSGSKTPKIPGATEPVNEQDQP